MSQWIVALQQRRHEGSSRGDTASADSDGEHAQQHPEQEQQQSRQHLGVGSQDLGNDKSVDLLQYDNASVTKLWRSYLESPEDSKRDEYWNEVVHGFHHLHSGVRSNPTSFYEFRKFAIVVAKKLTEALLAKLPEHLENVTYGGKVANELLAYLTGPGQHVLIVADIISKTPSGAEDLARNGKFTSTLLVTLTYIVSRLALRGGSGDGSRNDGMAAADNLFSTLTTLFKSPLAVESLLHSDGLGPLLTLMDFYSKVDNDQWRTRITTLFGTLVEARVASDSSLIDALHANGAVLVILESIKANKSSAHVVTQARTLHKLIEESCKLSSKLLLDLSENRGYEILVDFLVANTVDEDESDDDDAPGRQRYSFAGHSASSTELTDKDPMRPFQIQVVNILESLVFVGTKDIVTKAPSPAAVRSAIVSPVPTSAPDATKSNNPFDDDDEHAQNPAGARSPEVTIRNIQAFLALKKAFLKSSSYLVRERILHVILNLFTLHPMNYGIVEDCHILVPILETLDTLPFELRRRVLELLQLIVFGIKDAPKPTAELEVLSNLLQRKQCEPVTVSIILDSVSKFVSADSSYQSILSELFVGVVDLFETFVNTSDRSPQSGAPSVVFEASRFNDTFLTPRTFDTAAASPNISATMEEHKNLVLEELFHRLSECLLCFLESNQENINKFRETFTADLTILLGPSSTRADAIRVLTLLVSEDATQESKDVAQVVSFLQNRLLIQNSSCLLDVLQMLTKFFRVVPFTRDSFRLAGGFEILIKLLGDLNSPAFENKLLQDVAIIFRAIFAVFTAALADSQSNLAYCGDSHNFSALGQAVLQSGLLEHSTSNHALYVQVATAVVLIQTSATALQFGTAWDGSASQSYSSVPNIVAPEALGPLFVSIAAASPRSLEESLLKQVNTLVLCSPSNTLVAAQSETFTIALLQLYGPQLLHLLEPKKHTDDELTGALTRALQNKIGIDKTHELFLETKTASPIIALASSPVQTLTSPPLSGMSHSASSELKLVAGGIESLSVSLGKGIADDHLKNYRVLPEHHCQEILTPLLEALLSTHVSHKTLESLLGLLQLQQGACLPVPVPSLPFLLLLKSTVAKGRTPAHIEFDMSASEAASVMLPPLTGGDERTRSWPPGVGYTFSVWFRVIHFDSSEQKAPIEILTIMDANNHPILSVSIGSTNSQRLSVRVGARDLQEFDKFDFKENTWYHIAIVHQRSKAPMTGVLTLFVDGLQAVKPTHCTYLPSTDPSTGVIAWLGSKSLKSSVRWQLGPAHMIEDILDQGRVNAIYNVGPSYIGDFQGSLRKFMTNETLDSSNLDESKLADLKRGNEPLTDPFQKAFEITVLGVPEERIIFSIHARNAYKSWIDFGPVAKETYIADTNTPWSITVPKSKQSILRGKALVVANTGMPEALRRIGSIQFALKMDRPTLNASIEFLVNLVKYNWRLASEMERLNGYQLLGALLGKKKDLINLELMKMLLFLVGKAPDNRSDAVIANRSAYRYLFLNFSLWEGVHISLQKAFFLQLYDFCIKSELLAFNVRRLVTMRIVRQLLDCLEKELFPSEFVKDIVNLLSIFVKTDHSQLVHISRFLNYTLSPNVSQRIGALLQDKNWSTTTAIPGNSTGTASGGQSPFVRPRRSMPSGSLKGTGPSTAPPSILRPVIGDTRDRELVRPVAGIIGVRNSLLNMLNLCVGEDWQRENSLSNSFTKLEPDPLKWLLLQLGEGVHPHTVHLGLRLLVRLLVQRQANLTKFRQNGGFGVLRRLLTSRWNVLQLYVPLLALFLGADLGTVPLETPLDAAELLARFMSDPQKVHVYCPEAVSIILSMLQTMIGAIVVATTNRLSLVETASFIVSEQPPKPVIDVATQEVDKIVDGINTAHAQLITLLREMYTKSSEIRDALVRTDTLEEVIAVIFPLLAAHGRVHLECLGGPSASAGPSFLATPAVAALFSQAPPITPSSANSTSSTVPAVSIPVPTLATAVGTTAASVLSPAAIAASGSINSGDLATEGAGDEPKRRMTLRHLKQQQQQGTSADEPAASAAQTTAGSNSLTTPTDTRPRRSSFSAFISILSSTSSASSAPSSGASSESGGVDTASLEDTATRGDSAGTSEATSPAIDPSRSPPPTQPTSANRNESFDYIAAVDTTPEATAADQYGWLPLDKERTVAEVLADLSEPAQLLLKRTKPIHQALWSFVDVFLSDALFNTTAAATGYPLTMKEGAALSSSRSSGLLDATLECLPSDSRTDHLAFCGVLFKRCAELIQQQLRVTDEVLRAAIGHFNRATTFLVDRLSQSLFPGGGPILLMLLIEYISRYQGIEQTASKFTLRALLGGPAEPNWSVVQRNLARVVLHQFLVASGADKALALRRFRVYEGTLFAQIDADALKALTYHLYSSLYAAEPDVVKTSIELWKAVMIRRRTDMDALFKRTRNKEFTGITEKFDHLKQGREDLFRHYFTSPNGRGDLDLIFGEAPLKCWNNYTSNEAKNVVDIGSQSQKNKAARVKKRAKRDQNEFESMEKIIKFLPWHALEFDKETRRQAQIFQDKIELEAQVENRLTTVMGALFNTPELYAPQGKHKELERWKLDLSEGPSRMRKKMIQNKKFYAHYPYRLLSTELQMLQKLGVNLAPAIEGTNGLPGPIVYLTGNDLTVDQQDIRPATSGFSREFFYLHLGLTSPSPQLLLALTTAPVPVPSPKPSLSTEEEIKVVQPVVQEPETAHDAHEDDAHDVHDGDDGPVSPSRPELKRLGWLKHARRESRSSSPLVWTPTDEKAVEKAHSAMLQQRKSSRELFVLDGQGEDSAAAGLPPAKADLPEPAIVTIADDDLAPPVPDKDDFTGTLLSPEADSNDPTAANANNQGNQAALDEDGEAVGPIVTEGEEIVLKVKREIQAMLEPNEGRVESYNCARVVGLDVWEGLLLLGKNNVYLVDNYIMNREGKFMPVWSVPAQEREFSLLTMAVAGTSVTSAGAHDANGKSSGKPGKEEAREHQKRYWSYRDIREVHLRRFLLRDSAIEFFLSDGRSYLVSLELRSRDPVHNRVLNRMKTLGSNHEPTLGGALINTTAEVGLRFGSLFQGTTQLDELCDRWQRREISNFTYLMSLNTLAGRTYNDLTQYPVFPWILRDYESDQLDLTDPNTFRDLSKPMGAQTVPRVEEFIERFEVLDDPSMPPFHYGTHYSSAMATCLFLIRMEPFTQEYLKVQGCFDHPDRLFHSVRDAWLSASQLNTADVKELIPEFFYLPEMFVNQNQYDLGVRATGVRLGNVELPKWAHDDPVLFVHLHRKALECEYISQNLHKWIDLIFGYKQRGKAAIEAVNVFHYLSYENAVDIDAIDDPVQKAATIGIINHFGQTPRQLFTKPHKTRQPQPPAPLSIQSTPFLVVQSLLPIRNLSNSDAILTANSGTQQLLAAINDPSVGGSSSATGGTLSRQASSSATTSLRSANSVGGGSGQIPSLETIVANPSAALQLYSLYNAPDGPVPVAHIRPASGPQDRSASGNTPVVVAGPGTAISPGPLGRAATWGRLDNTLRLHASISSLDKALLTVDSVHHGSVTTAAWADDNTLITGGMDGLILVCHVQPSTTRTDGLDMVIKATLRGHGGPVSAFAISRSYMMLVSGSQDGTVLVWDLYQLSSIRDLPSHDEPVQSLAVSDVHGFITTATASTLRVLTINGDLLSEIVCEPVQKGGRVGFDLPGASRGPHPYRPLKAVAAPFAPLLPSQGLLCATFVEVATGLEGECEVAIASGHADGRICLWNLTWQPPVRSTDRGWMLSLQRVVYNQLWVPLVPLAPGGSAAATSASASTAAPGPLASAATFVTSPASSTAAGGAGASIETAAASATGSSGGLLQRVTGIVSTSTKPSSPAPLPSGDSIGTGLVTGSTLTSLPVTSAGVNVSSGSLSTAGTVQVGPNERVPITAIACSPEQRRIYVGDSLGRVFAWSLPDSDERHWVRDSAVDLCMGCGTRFALMVDRKSHCRACGGVFCQLCSRFEVDLSATSSASASGPLASSASASANTTGAANSTGGEVASSSSKVAVQRSARTCGRCFVQIKSNI